MCRAPQDKADYSLGRTLSGSTSCLVAQKSSKARQAPIRDGGFGAEVYPYLTWSRFEPGQTSEQEGLNLKTRFTTRTVLTYQLVKAGLGVSLIRL